MSDVLAKLRAALCDGIRTDAETLAAHRRDRWVLAELDDVNDEPAPPPLAVLEPSSTAEVSTVLRLCRKAGVPIIPFGGGSGVCGAIRGRPDAVVLSTRRLQGIVELDRPNLCARIRAGTNGLEAEQALAGEGLTLGHWPQSIALSTVGGWVATRASGQFSTAYGGIENLILELEVVLPDGAVLRTRRSPRAAAGPDLRQLFLGSEGTLGVVTEVGFSLRLQAAARVGQAFHFPDFAGGLRAVQNVIQEGWTPPVARVYDARESRRHFRAQCPKGRHALIWLHEGPAAAVPVEQQRVAELCRDAGGDPMDSGAVDTWLAHRNEVPGFRTFLDQGIILDTIEVACAWDQAAGLYQRVTGSLSEVDGLLAGTGHSSHSYRSGTCLYFTFVARPRKREDMAAVYRDCWRRTLDATVAAGGTISHHHGIGRVRRDRLGDELGDTGLALLRRVKETLDPKNLMNPGVLLPEVSSTESAP